MAQILDQRDAALARTGDPATLRRHECGRPGDPRLRHAGRAPQSVLAAHASRANKEICRTALYWSAIEAGCWVVFGAAFTTALVIIGHQAVDGTLSAGAVVVVITLATQVSTTMGALAFSVSSVGGSTQAAEKLQWLRTYSQDQARPESARSSWRREGRPRTCLLISARVSVSRTSVLVIQAPVEMFSGTSTCCYQLVPSSRSWVRTAPASPPW